jgi:uncharacterized protein YqhQ
MLFEGSLTAHNRFCNFLCVLLRENAKARGCMNILAIKREILISGQAVIEGVMIRTSSAYAVVCRKPDGSIAHKAEIIPRWCEKYKFLSLPLVRGCTTLLQSMAIGIKAFNFSATVFEENSTDQKTKKSEQESNVAFTVIFAILFNILLLIVVPFLLASSLFINFDWCGLSGVKNFPLSGVSSNSYLWQIKPSSWLLFNLLDGIFRAMFFLLMIFLMSISSDIKRIFQYHGAEHKTVSVWEKGLNLTIENAKREPRQHPRCGTSFLALAIIVSAILYLPISFDSTWMNLLARIVLLPVVVGVSFEMLWYASKKESGLMLSVLILPGIWLQKITTQEPDEKQLEVAIFSLKKSLELENQEISF